MAITAALVKELRERTQAGMMECKKALVETNGDIDAAVEYMRKAGLAKADKKSGRTAAEGQIVIETSADQKTVVIIEINCETDFVIKSDDFQQFASQIAALAIANQPDNINALLGMTMDSGSTVAEATKSLIAKVGENINVRRYAKITSNGVLGSYLHGTRIGVITELEGGDIGLAKDIAMHIAATKPVCVSSDEVSDDIINKEKEIYTAQAAESGKPADIVEKMVTGRIAKFLKEITLMGQSYVKDPDITVEKLIKKNKAKVLGFYRFEVGEGIEKKEENFAEEVMAQVKGS
ncbi:MAG: elongation factor Ts [Gammaproteobacteria bacterium]|nr:elongation factor Ts [Gammaproteobacteria bacterium]